MNSPSKYAIAQINIPIEIFPNGEWTNHNDRITIQIMRTHELPPISNIENHELLQTIQGILGGSQESDSEPASKISLNLGDNDKDSPPPFIVRIREPIEEPPKIPSKSEPNTTEYIDHQELLLRRRHRKPSKNTTFKCSHKKPQSNKTRSNRWMAGSQHPCK